MAIHDTFETDESTIPAALRRFLSRRLFELVALVMTGLIFASALALASWSINDPSFNHATGAKAENWLGSFGAILSDQMIQLLGLGVLPFLFIPLTWAAQLFQHEAIDGLRRRLLFWLCATFAVCCFLACLPTPSSWPLASGLGGNVGEIVTAVLFSVLSIGIKGIVAQALVALAALALCWWSLPRAAAIDTTALRAIVQAFLSSILNRSARPAQMKAAARPAASSQWLQWFTSLLSQPAPKTRLAKRTHPNFSGGGDVLSRFTPLSLRKLNMAPGEEAGPFVDDENSDGLASEESFDEGDEEITTPRKVHKPAPKARTKLTHKRFVLPDLELLAEPKKVGRLPEFNKEFLEENARRLESVLEDFGVRGQIINVRPGPVVTLYELEPAPGIKSSRVISLADDIARSMSAVSARVAVVSGRNAIGIELPNSKRETVYLRELFQSETFSKNNTNLTLALGKNIGGEPIFADLARMPHLLIAGTTGSGKSVGINTMILSLLYRLPPERCKLIMIDPKMLELSVYEGIPHLLAPVVTDPRKAVVALKWAVREMEDRYKKMSKTGVRNVDGYNAKLAQMLEKGQKLSRTVQTGFDAETGQPVFELEEMDLQPMPYIVVIIDEMADLMMVAGKDIEGAVQRLAQMARAAGIHVVMATQRPSVDVITGTIKANFPTRISFQVTSKIDSRTILGEQGAEQLLGQGDMLYMAGGGRISRLHAPFVSDGEVEAIVNHLKTQGAPEYVEAVTEEEDEEVMAEGGGFAGPEGGSGDDLYDQAVQVVLRDKKVSTSYVQRRLGVGYNKAATLIERMEKEGVISSPNGQGKREILVPGDSARA
jgi:S-DNA-T family DNA segregation ATPase FtsK/SpoIIIE